MHGTSSVFTAEMISMAHPLFVVSVVMIGTGEEPDNDSNVHVVLLPSPQVICSLVQWRAQPHAQPQRR